MHWYVYPLAAVASVLLGHFLVDQVGQPIRSVLHLSAHGSQADDALSQCSTTQGARAGDHVAGNP